jgi:hypothetical protein
VRRFAAALAAAAAFAALAAAAAFAAHGADRFSFAVLGDTPYFPHEVFAVPQLLASLAGADVAFAVHVGDIKHGSVPCSDELLAARKAMLDATPVPIVFVPGDNDWTDCHREAAGGYDPVERLDRVRALFHSGESSLGRRTIALERQSADPRFRAYRENARWSAGAIVFATLNIPGSNNNLGRNRAGDAEHAARMKANLEWLDEAVRRAEAPAMGGLVIFAHGDPRFGRAPRKVDGYRTYREVLRTRASSLGKPMLLVHGDGHRYRVDQPLHDLATGALLPNFTRVEVFGSPAVNWVRIDVDPAAERLFNIAPGVPTTPATP